MPIFVLTIRDSEKDDSVIVNCEINKPIKSIRFARNGSKAQKIALHIAQFLKMIGLDGQLSIVEEEEEGARIELPSDAFFKYFYLDCENDYTSPTHALIGAWCSDCAGEVPLAIYPLLGDATLNVCTGCGKVDIQDAEGNTRFVEYKPKTDERLDQMMEDILSNHTFSEENGQCTKCGESVNYLIYHEMTFCTGRPRINKQEAH